MLKTAKNKSFFQHRYDKCMLIKRDPQGRLLVLIHVDDFLVTFREDYDIEELKDMFRWGSMTLLSLTMKSPSAARRSSSTLSMASTLCRVTQKAFINEMSTGQLARGRLQADTLNSEEQK